MSMKLTIFKQDGPADFIQVAAFGDISLEAAEHWIDSVKENLTVIGAKSEQLDFQLDSYQLPEGGDMTELSFKNKDSVDKWAYGFEGTPVELDRLVDKIAVIQGRADLAQMS